MTARAKVLRPVVCDCRAYPFPHAPRGKCSRSALRENLGPSTCSARAHRTDCRPGRPLCRFRRKQKGLCHCGYPHHPHREGSCKPDLDAACAEYDRRRAAR